MIYTATSLQRVTACEHSVGSIQNSKFPYQVLWEKICSEAQTLITESAFAADYVKKYILAHSTMSQALVFLLAEKLAPCIPFKPICLLLESLYSRNPDLIGHACGDLEAILSRDPAALWACSAFCHSKGFHALQLHRIAHTLWHKDERFSALSVSSATSHLLNVDIHPAAQFGKRILIDHAIGVVVGETTVIGDDVSILHGVTLGGTGRDCGDRHPKIHGGVLIGANATILGNVTIGENSKIGAGSVVLKNVPSNHVATGIPAVSKAKSRFAEKPSISLDHSFLDDEFTDYLI